MKLLNHIQDQLDRFRGAKADRIEQLPLAILMPHSACNCRCLMCDIWKANAHKKQLTKQDILSLLDSFTRLGTKQVLFSGGEALLHPLFFEFARLLKEQGLQITLLSTGLGLKQHAEELTRYTDELILSLDGDEETHDQIRGIPGAFEKIREGMLKLRSLDPAFPVKARSVIHKLNFEKMPAMIRLARQLGFDQISFFPADVSSSAFNREIPWEQDRQQDLLLNVPELERFQQVLDQVFREHISDFKEGFIAEPAARLQQLYQYYAAQLGLAHFPYRRCNAPWVSTVIEADGKIRHCFFLEELGHIGDGPLQETLNNENALGFRRKLNTNTHETCRKCVCTLYLNPNSKTGP